MYIPIWASVLLIMVVFISGFILCALLVANIEEGVNNEGNTVPRAEHDIHQARRDE